MSSAAVHGPVRAVLLSRGPDIRGTTAEFRHAGFLVASRDDVLGALVEVARDPEAILIISSDLDELPLRDMLDLAVAVCGTRLLVGLGVGDGATVMRAALSAGVRDSVELPLTPARLLQAIRRLPRSADGHEEPVCVGDLMVDPGRHEVMWQGTAIEVTPREFAILLALTQAHPYLATLEQLAVEYAGTASDPIASLRVTIKGIRSRLAAVGARPLPTIETVRGVGYRLAC